MNYEQELNRNIKRHREMIGCLEKLQKLCREEGSCEHGCPLAHYGSENDAKCSFVQLEGPCCLS